MDRFGLRGGDAMAAGGGTGVSFNALYAVRALACKRIRMILTLILWTSVMMLKS